MNRDGLKNYGSLALWILLFELVSLAIGMQTQGAANGWYQTLNAPSLVPPAAAFPVVWAVLYVFIATAGWILWRRRHMPYGLLLLALFAAYMALNWSWNIVFFLGHALLAGLVWIVVMNILALILIVRASNTARAVSWLMTPPTLWTFYALYLNAGYWWLN